MRYRTQRELLDEMRPLIDKLKMVPDNGSEAKALVTRLTDLRIAVEATNRHDLFSPSPKKENTNPAAGDYWIDTPRNRDELYFSAIVEKLSSVSREDLVMLVATLLIGKVGFVEASIERLSWQAKKNGKIKLPDGREVTPNSIREVLLNDSLHAALSRIVKLNELMLIGKQRARRKSGEGTQSPRGNANKEEALSHYVVGMTAKTLRKTLEKEGFIVTECDKTLQNWMKEERAKNENS